MPVVLNILESLWATLRQMAPYLLFGFLMAGILSALIPAAWIERHLGRGRFLPVVKAALFGVPLPLCSCSVIPVAVTLHRQGANRGAVAAFLVSTPQTGVDSIFVAFSLLGLGFAIFDPLAAFLSGLVTGFLVSLLVRDGEDRPLSGAEPAPAACCSSRAGAPDLLSLAPRPPAKSSCCAGAVPAVTPASCCSTKAAPASGTPAAWRQILRHGFVTLPRDIANPLLAGLLIAGVMSAFLGDAILAGVGSGFTAKLVLLLVGIPLYVCSTASIPIAAALVAAGVSPGAALVFLMSGPATNAATITTLWSRLGRKTATIYLVSMGCCALLAGTVLDYFYVREVFEVAPPEHEMLPGWAETASAIGLVVLLIAARYGRSLTNLARRRNPSVPSLG